MAKTNRQRIDEALEILREGLIPFAEQELSATYGDDWITNANSGLTHELKVQDGKIQWDTYALLKVMWDHWNSVFKNTLGRVDRNYLSELQQVRNDHAHEEKFSYDDTDRALDTARRLLESCTAPTEAKKLADLRKDLIRIQQAEEARVQTRYAKAADGTPSAGLKPWREVISPHSDVAKGRYSESEFAADLAKVHKGEASHEYSDPTAFFSRTFITEGLRELLQIGVRRLTGQGGDPVVELKTNFGGGKTHSMLALYHIFGGGKPGDLPGMEEILTEEGVTSLPTAKRAVIVGTDMPPGQPRKKPDGTLVHTLWGELAWQLGGSEGYAMVADSDTNGTNPGSGILEDLFKAYSPCLILIDEWVAYLRQLPGKDNLPGGSEDANFSFAQALTEAVKVCPTCLLVASLPVSDIEIGGDHGKAALDRLSNIFKRVAKPWEPASSAEGFEIVRRRLFDTSMDFAARDNVVKAFMELYQKDGSFPSAAKEDSYRKRLEACYPIHPELFERLDHDWSRLDRFQRTRGVLRLMAAVIYELWTSETNGLLIMPSSVPLESARVRSLITECLPDGNQWKPVISRDIDGPESLPLLIDSENPNFNKVSAARRVSRTIFLGSAATLNSNTVGIEDPNMRLGCVQPGENANAFGDALRRLTDRAMHLYADGGRYWYSLSPTVSRLASDRANQLKDQPEVVNEITRRLKENDEKGSFAGIHIAPQETGDVSDDTKTRLVILGPDYDHARSATESTALSYAGKILEGRGNSPRLHRNTLVFLAADKTRLDQLKTEAALYLAWASIFDEAENEELELTTHAKGQAKTKKRDFDNSCSIKLRESWQWCLVPYQPDATQPEIAWESLSIPGQDPLAGKAGKKLTSDELLFGVLGPARLQMELDRYLWKGRDHIPVKQLAEAFSNYLYLPRLSHPSVLLQSIETAFVGILIEHFAYSTGYDEAKSRYTGLQTTTLRTSIDLAGDGLLVKVEPATKQEEADKAATGATTPDPGGGTEPGGTSPTGGTDSGETTTPTGTAGGSTTPPETPGLPKRFFASHSIDGAKPGAALKVSDIFAEVITHLTKHPGNKITLSLNIEASSEPGYDETTQRTVKENANTLGFDTNEFE